MIKKYQNLFIILSAMIVGFLAGILGAIIVENHIMSASSSTNLRFSDNANNNALIFEERQADIKNTPVDILGKSIVGIAKARGKTEKISESYYLPQDIISYGFVLTDDGWIVTLAKDLEKEISGELVVINNNNVFSFKDKIVDPSTGILFMKVETNGNRLTPLKIGDSDELSVLDDLISIDLFKNVSSHTVINHNNVDSLIQSSEVLGRRLIMDGSGYHGSVVVNSRSEVLGIIDGVNDGTTSAIPVNYFKDLVGQVLDAGTIDRVLLGVNYIDLSAFPRNGDIATGVDRNIGALVYSPQIIDAVISGSPARLSGVKYKDIIISIEGEELGIKKNLSEIIQEYKMSSEINMKIIRDGVERSIVVKLTNIK